MHYVFCSAGSVGDHFPYFRLAIALKSKGHRVSCFTHPGFRGMVEANGLEFVPQVPQPPSKLLTNFDSEATCLKLMDNLIEPNIMPLYNWLESNYIPGEMTVISSKILLGARLAQEKLGVPLITFELTPNQFNYFLTQRREKVNALLTHRIAPYREALNLPEFKDLFNWLPSPDAVMGGFPSWFWEKESHWPAQTRLIDFPFENNPEGKKGIPKGVRVFLDGGEKPFLFSMNCLMKNAGEHMQLIEEVCKKLGIRAIILTRNPGEGVVATENLYKAPMVIIPPLLPYISGIFYLGGIGTFSEALRGGLPQLVSHLARNQDPQIAFIKDRNLGLVLNQDQWTEANLTEALSKLTQDPEIAANCRSEAMRYHDKSSSIEEFLDYIETFAEKTAQPVSV